MTKEKPATKKKKVDYHKMYAEIGKNNGKDVKEWKRITDERKAAGQHPVYVNPVMMAYRLARYMDQQDRITWTNTTGTHMGKPYTGEGGRLALSIKGNGCWEKYVNGEMDHYVTARETHFFQTMFDGLQELKISQVPPEHLKYTLFLLGHPDWDIITDTAGLDDWADKVYFSDILGTYASIVQAQRECDLYDKGRTADIFVHKARYGWQEEDVKVVRHELIDPAEAKRLMMEVAEAEGELIK